jgi:hypothetical protein
LLLSDCSLLAVIDSQFLLLGLCAGSLDLELPVGLAFGSQLRFGWRNFARASWASTGRRVYRCSHLLTAAGGIVGLDRISRGVEGR